MSLILNIDTALTTASVSIAKDGSVISFRENPNPKDHSAWLHTAIQQLLAETTTDKTKLAAIAVNIGPGSYTGLRVGLSAAKGICYALRIKLITINSLELLAFAVREEAEDLILAAIDARRMEVFGAMYQKSLTEIQPPSAIIIDKHSFETVLNEHKVLFCGNGSAKIKDLVKHTNALFSKTVTNSKHMAELSYRFFKLGKFSDLVNADPAYVKEPFS